MLDRRAEARLSATWLEDARGDPQTRYLVMRGAAALVSDNGPGCRAVMLRAEDERVAGVDDADRMVLLGWYRDCRCVLVDLPPALAAPRPGERFAELRALVADLPEDEAELLASARALNLWRLANLHCGRCGSRMLAARAGYARRCSACEALVFPRLDPAVIVLVHDGTHALLGRQHTWPPGRFSALAGFVEPGETLEDAVRREVQEEAGIDLSHIAYHSSQPWPYPASLMLGFTATATRAPPVLHDGELEDAQWFTRDELTHGAVLLPPPSTIARRLIEEWIHRQ